MAKQRRTGSVARFFQRTVLVILTAAILLVAGTHTLLGTVFQGPSQIARNELTLALMAEPATAWIPGIYLEDALIDQICE